MLFTYCIFGFEGRTSNNKEGRDKNKFKSGGGNAEFSILEGGLAKRGGTQNFRNWRGELKGGKHDFKKKLEGELTQEDTMNEVLWTTDLFESEIKGNFFCSFDKVLATIYQYII